ncbi:hypothetical protein L1994_11700 [Methanomicrobium antiquum]|uniref:Uncharacterized protein n=1 Tax=Methanomicrobium antiquum TaxID=487686 RepID=A0AAF0FQM0_9EURY|nr:hypothetical protein [Methanomicrobium antiquum]WFN36782.1 hypothetical protein L1994_11700 [Methanomicrobium antiquum]
MITEIISSILMLIFTIVIIFISGFLLSLLLIPKHYQEDYFWILMPFLGIPFVIILLQTIIYLNVPLSLSVYPYFFIILAGTYVYYKRNKPQIPKIPTLLFILAIVVLATNGIGYFVLGSSNYLGYGWIDQHNYVGISQFLMDKSFSTSLDDIGDTPYLVDAILKKDDRIGQSVLQGYVAVLSFQNAKTAYGAISLLSPLLTFFVIWIYSRRLIKDEWAQYGAAISAACIPGFALIHLQDFLSQALAVPFLLISPLIIYLALKEKDWRFVTIGILILASIHSIYTEFTLLFIALAICGMIWYILQKNAIIPSISVITLIITGGLLINIGYIGRSIAIMTRGNDMPNVLQAIFPFAETIEGLGYLWFGYSGSLLESSFLIFVINIFAALLTIAGYTGIINAMRRDKNVMCILLFIILLFPLALLSQSEPYPYQFYKMLMTVSPILMLGVWMLLSEFWEYSKDDVNCHIKDQLHPIIYKIPKIVLICLLISSVIITGYLASFSITGGYRSAVEIDNAKEMIDIYNYLEQTKNQDFILSISHPYPLAWAAYHGRNDRIYFINNVIGDVPLERVYPNTFLFNNISEFPQNAKKLTLGSEYPQLSGDIDDSLIALIDNPQGMEGTEGSEYNWLGKEMRINLYWQGDQEQNITLSYLSDPGLGYPDSNKRIVKVSMIKGKSQQDLIIETNGTETVSIPLVIKPGLNIVDFKTIYPENTSVIIPGDPREFFVRISQMKIVGET